MTRPIRILLIVLVAAAALSAGYFVQRGGSGSARDVPLDKASSSTLLSAELPNLEGKTSRLSDWQGKVMVVNFWATWCAPCREEMPALVRTQTKLGARGLQIIGIALDGIERVKPFSAEMGVNYPILLSGVEGLELAKAAGNDIGALPFTVFIDRSGKVIKAELGGVTEKSLENILLPLL